MAYFALPSEGRWLKLLSILVSFSGTPSRRRKGGRPGPEGGVQLDGKRICPPGILSAREVKVVTQDAGREPHCTAPGSASEGLA